eukprot:365180-Chlamydomonas_euryale.AAC.6
MFTRRPRSGARGPAMLVAWRRAEGQASGAERMAGRQPLMVATRVRGDGVVERPVRCQGRSNPRPRERAKRGEG